MTVIAGRIRGWCRHDLPGGLPMLTRLRAGAGLVAVRLWIRGGSSRDPRGQRGAMQLLAGTMTRGAGAHDSDALAELVEGRGAALRSEATEDALVLSLKCASEDAADLVPLLLAMAGEPTLSPDQVELERELNLQHLQRQREDPFQLAHDGLRELLFGDGAYGHDPLGVEEELARLGPADLEPLVRDLAEPGALLVLCGDLDQGLADQLDALLTRSPWPTRSPRAEPWSAPPPLRTSLALQEQDTEQLVVMLGAATVPLGHPDSLALRLLQAHLGVGMSSRLFQEMRERRGLAYDVGVHMPARCAATPFVIHLSTSLARAREACEALLEEWRRLSAELLGDADLRLALAKFRGQDAMGRQTCAQVADRQALVLGHGLGERYVDECLERAGRLTPEELRSAARRWLARPALSLCGPVEALKAGEGLWTGAGGGR